MDNLRDLGDVDLETNPPVNNDVLSYDSTKATWVPKNSIIFEDWVINGGESVLLIDETPPENISNILVYNIDKTSITIKWNDSPSIEDIKDYTIYNGPTLLKVVTGTVVDITGLNPSTHYTFTVKARDNWNNESGGISISIKTLGSYAISMNGISDYIKLPSITFDSIELTCSIKPALGKWSYYMDTRNGTSLGYIARTSSGMDSFGSSWGAVYINGVLKTNNSPITPSDTKNTIRAVLTSPATDDVNIFSNSSGKELMHGVIYDIKLFNGTGLVAHYDFTQQFTGTFIPDSSGNGQIATLYGGSWIEA